MTMCNALDSSIDLFKDITLFIDPRSTQKYDSMLLSMENMNNSCTCGRYFFMLLWPSVADMMLSPMLSIYASFMISESNDVL